MKPLGFYVSAPSDQFDAGILAKLEEKYGSFFNKASVAELWFALTYAAMDEQFAYLNDRDGTADMLVSEFGILIKSLSKDLLFQMIPFLHQAIAERRQEPTDTDRPEKVYPPIVIHDGDEDGEEKAFSLPYEEISGIEIDSLSRRFTFWMKPEHGQEEYTSSQQDYDSVIEWLAECGISPSDWDQSAITL
jgi:hypothetical protein